MSGIERTKESAIADASKALLHVWTVSAYPTKTGTPFYGDKPTADAWKELAEFFENKCAALHTTADELLERGSAIDAAIADDVLELEKQLATLALVMRGHTYGFRYPTVPR